MNISGESDSDSEEDVHQEVENALSKSDRKLVKKEQDVKIDLSN